MGRSQDNSPGPPSTRPRVCLRKGCGEVFQPACWNQRYCQQPDCLREVRRWQALKRQRKHRESPENRKRHASAEAERRRSEKAKPAKEASESPGQQRAWSRSKGIPAEFCDRTGCYEPLPAASRAPARYCGHACRQAVRRVLDRERKWLKRNPYVRSRRRRRSSPNGDDSSLIPGSDRQKRPAQRRDQPVGDYRETERSSLSCPVIEPPGNDETGVRDAHSETRPAGRSRPPPAS